MVKRILNVLVLISVILIPGCKKDKYSGKFKNDEEVEYYGVARPLHTVK